MCQYESIIWFLKRVVLQGWKESLEGEWGIARGTRESTEDLEQLLITSSGSFCLKHCFNFMLNLRPCSPAFSSRNLHQITLHSGSVCNITIWFTNIPRDGWFLCSIDWVLATSWSRGSMDVGPNVQNLLLFHGEIKKYWQIWILGTQSDLNLMITQNTKIYSLSWLSSINLNLIFTGPLLYLDIPTSQRKCLDCWTACL